MVGLVAGWVPWTAPFIDQNPTPNNLHSAEQPEIATGDPDHDDVCVNHGPEDVLDLAAGRAGRLLAELSTLFSDVNR
jgi:hypothetical protein